MNYFAIAIFAFAIVLIVKELIEAGSKYIGFNPNGKLLLDKIRAWAKRQTIDDRPDVHEDHSETRYR